jgi:hypothetical protein
MEATSDKVYGQIVSSIKDARTHRDILIALKRTFPNRTVSQTFLQADAQIRNSGELSFVINDKASASNTVNVSERRLDSNNYFIATHIGFFMKSVVSGAHAQAQLHTYPNPVALPDGTTASLNADLEAIYNGTTLWKTGSTTFIPALENQLFRKVPMWPQGQQINWFTGPEISSITTSPRDKNDGMFELAGRLLIDGNLTHEVKTIVPNGANLAMACDTANTVYYWTMKLRGLEIENVRG